MREIQIVDYHPAWPEMFTAEAQAISAALEGIPLRIHHIGSTAVPGLAAKATIDILLEVADFTVLEIKYPRLIGLGYRPRGENGMAGRRYFTKGETCRTHQIHAFLSGNMHVHRHLAFRDYLRANPAIAAEYAAIKRAAANGGTRSSAEYCALKDPFIQHHQAIALAQYPINSKSECV